MTVAAPRLDTRLVERLDRLARGSSTPAEIRRTLVTLARELELAPPSYEHVRRLVADARLELEIERARTSELVPLALRVAVGAEHGNELLRVARGERPRLR